MDGRDHPLDDAYSHRLWRSVGWENIYLNQYDAAR